MDVNYSSKLYVNPNDSCLLTTMMSFILIELSLSDNYDMDCKRYLQSFNHHHWNMQDTCAPRCGRWTCRFIQDSIRYIVVYLEGTQWT